MFIADFFEKFILNKNIILNSMMTMPPLTTKLALTVHSDVDLKFHHRGMIIQHDNVSYYALKTFTDEASVLQAIEGNSDRGVLLVRHSFTVKFVQKIKKSAETQNLLDSVIISYFSYKRTQADTAIKRNATLIFQKLDRFDKEKSENFYRNAYIQACLDRGYSFTRIDLPLIADVFERNISVYSCLGNLEANFGSQYSDTVVLVESDPQVDLSQSYTRFIPLPFLTSISEWWVDRQYTSIEAQRHLEFYNNINAYFYGQSQSEIFQLIFAYADIDFEFNINAGMQDILKKENWELLLQSYQNWKFVRTFQKQVTQLKYITDNTGVNKRVDLVICETLFPKLNSIDFSELADLNSYLATLCKNPHITSLKFDNILWENFYEIFKQIPQLATQLTTLTVKLCYDRTKIKTTLTISQLFQPFLNLEKLTLKFCTCVVAVPYLGLEDTILSMKKLTYLDLNKIAVSSEFLTTFIAERISSINAIDLSCSTKSSPPPKPVKYSLNWLVVKNAMSSMETYDAILLQCSKSPIIALNLSGANLSFKGLKSLESYAPTLKYLDLSNFRGDEYLSFLSELTNLKYLDLTGWLIHPKDMHYFAKLKKLEVLRAGGADYISGSGEESRSVEDTTRSTELKRALEQALPQVQLHFIPIIHTFRNRGRTSVKPGLI